MVQLDYTEKGRRPTVAQIISDWNKAGRPYEFEVFYGETYAHFQRVNGWGPQQWNADGNGCRGVDREKVRRTLCAKSVKVGLQL